MKKLFVVLSFITLNFQLKAQDKLNLSEVIKEVKNQKSLYYFAEIPQKKYKRQTKWNDRNLDSANFNLLQLPVKISSDNYHYYFVKNLDVLLVIRSYNHIKNPIN